MTIRVLAKRKRVLAIAGECSLPRGFAVVTSAQTDTFSAITPSRIMMLGDSITRGGGASWGQGFRLPMMQSLIAGQVLVGFRTVSQARPALALRSQSRGYPGYSIDDITALLLLN